MSGTAVLPVLATRIKRNRSNTLFFVSLSDHRCGIRSYTWAMVTVNMTHNFLYARMGQSAVDFFFANPMYNKPRPLSKNVGDLVCTERRGIISIRIWKCTGIKDRTRNPRFYGSTLLVSTTRTHSLNNT